MIRFICLLRSVNVSGVNLIKMKELKAFFETLGFQNVKTYIQSGNVIFEAKEKPSPSFLEAKIREKFHTKNVAVLIKTPEALETVIRQNPFKEQPELNLKKLYVYFLESTPDKKQAEELARYTFEDESFRLQKDVIYVYYNSGRGKARLSNAFFEKKLHIRATARNWNTTNKLLALAREG